jgi:hypothetical protein
LTPLLLALDQTGRAEMNATEKAILKALVEHGAQVNVKDEEGHLSCTVSLPCTMLPSSRPCWRMGRT